MTLIEEAHRLLRNVSTEQGSDVSANPKGRAIEVFANILSEIRAFGERLRIDPRGPAFKMTAMRDLERGLELYTTYGNITGSGAMLHFGFYPDES